MTQSEILAENVQAGDRIYTRNGEWMTVQTANVFSPPDDDDHIRFTGHVDGDTRRHTHFRHVGETVLVERAS